MNQSETKFDRRKALVETSIEKYHVYLHRYIQGLCGNAHDADDLMSELWVLVLNKFKEEHIQCLPILRRKAWQKCCDFARKRNRRPEVVTDVLPEIIASPSYDDDDENMEEKFWDEFPGIKLNDKQKSVIWLHARYQMPYNEISQKLGIPTSTICDYIKKSRSIIRNYLNNEGGAK